MSVCPLEAEPVALMPGVRAAVSAISLPMAIWANTRVAREPAIRVWLERAGLGSVFDTVITSVDAGVRKPAPEFFAYALARCRVAADDVLFVGNQRNTDIAGGEAAGIRTVWLSDEAYRSADDRSCDVTPTFTIDTLDELPALVRRLQGRGRR
jgi:putative hydrolase of the HAD superfamily